MTSYQWMDCCGISSLLFLGALIIMFVVSRCDEIGSHISQVTWRGFDEIENLHIGYTHQAFPAKFRVNFDIDKLASNMKSDFNIDKTDDEFIKQVCSQIGVVYKNDYLEDDDDSKLTHLEKQFKCMYDT